MNQDPTEKLLQEIQKDKPLIQQEIRSDTGFVSASSDVLKLQKKANFLQKFITKAKEQFLSDITYLRTQRKDLTTINATFLAKISGEKAELTKLANLIGNVKQNIEKSRQELDKYRRQEITTINMEVETKRKLIKEEENKLEGLKRELDNKEKTLTSYEENLKIQEGDNNQMQGFLLRDRKELSGKREKLDEEEEKLKQMKTDTERDYQNAKNLHTEQTRLLNNIESKLKGIIEQKNIVDDLRKKLSSEIDTREKIIKQKETDLTKKETELSQKERWLKDKESTLARAFRELERRKTVI